MTTTNGMRSPKAIRGAIETLRRRRDWVADKMAEKYDNDPIRTGGSFERAEISALDLAIEVLETEWDTAARFARNSRNVPSAFTPDGRELEYIRHARWEGPESSQPEIRKTS